MVKGYPGAGAPVPGTSSISFNRFFPSPSPPQQLLLDPPLPSAQERVLLARLAHVRPIDGDVRPFLIRHGRGGRRVDAGRHAEMFIIKFYSNEWGPNINKRQEFGL